jgi:hypothetical protein
MMKDFIIISTKSPRHQEILLNLVTWCLGGYLFIFIKSDVP